MGTTRRGQLENLLNEAYQLKSELESALLTPTGPVEKTRLQKELAKTDQQINQYLTELGQLRADEATEIAYLQLVASTYQDWLLQYTEPTSALTLNRAEFQRHRPLFDLLSLRHPPTDPTDRFYQSNLTRNSELKTQNSVVRAPILEQIAAMPCAAILGAPGAGKTTALRRVALHYALVALGREQPATDDPHAGKIPVLIPLGGYAGEDLLDFIRAFLSRRRPDYADSPALANGLQTILDQGRLLLLFDALNEIAEDHRAIAFKQITDFADAYCSQRLSHRNSFFLSCREADYSEGFAGLPRLILQPLDDDQINAFLHNYFANNPAASKNITAQLDINEGNLHEVVRNPYLLKVVVELYQSQGNLPTSRGQLFRAFARDLLAWGFRRSTDLQLLQMLLPGQQLTGLTPATLDHATSQLVLERLTLVIEPLLAQLAYSMLSDQSQGTEASLDWAFTQLPPLAISSFTYRQNLKLQNATVQLETGLALDLARLGGLLNLIELSAGPSQARLRFSHQLLQEYFAALHLARQAATPTEWQSAARSYNFDEVFLLLTNLSLDPIPPIKAIKPVDLALACRCAALLLPEKLDPLLRRELLEEAITKLKNKTEQGSYGAIQGLAHLKASRELAENGLNHPNPNIRRDTIELLETLKAKETSPLLAQRLYDEVFDVHSKALDVLVEWGTKEIIPQLLERIGDREFYKTDSPPGPGGSYYSITQKEGNIVQAFVKLSPKQTTPQLVELLIVADKDYTDPENGGHIVRDNIIEILKAFETKEAIPLLIEQLNHKDNRVRSSVLYALGTLGAKEAIPKIIQQLSAQDSSVRYFAAQALGNLNAPLPIPQLIPLLEDQDKWVSAAALYALSMGGAQVDINRILKILGTILYPSPGTRSSEVQAYLFASLKKPGIKNITPDLIQSLKNQDKSIRLGALYVLSWEKVKKATPSVIECLNDEDSEVRGEALNALIELQGKKAKTIFLERLNDPDPNIRSTAIYALRELNVKEAITQIIEKLEDEDEMVRQEAAIALQELEAAQAIPYLIPHLEDKSSSVRDEVIYTLEVLEAKEANPKLIQCLFDDDPSVRSSALQALESLGDKEVVDRLKELPEHPDKQMREGIYNLRETLKKELRLPKDYFVTGQF